ncbi:MAG: DUF3987 domain-containing protein [Planctomycetes bacterium]|nr:DUF3987 domain-containing protein [Planctomycetota bacterium]
MTDRQSEPDDNDLLRENLLPEDPAMGCLPYRDPADDEEAEGDDRALPPYPLDVLPPRVREVVEGFADAVCAPVELAALPCLAAVSAALGPGWRCGPANFVRAPLLWFGVVAPPGTSKSPAARPVFAPLYRADKRLGEEHDLAKEQFEKAQKSRGGEEAVQPGRRRHLIVTDTTPEALEAALEAADGHGLLAHSDELARLLGGLPGYSSGRGRAGRAAWLSTWSGEPIRVVRKSAPTVEVDNPHLVVFGGIQPDTLGRVGLGEGDGLLPRFLWASVVPRAHGLGDGIDPALANRWGRLLRQALAIGEVAVQPFRPEARRALSERLREWTGRAVQLGKAGLGLKAGAYAKAADQVVRLSALLHGLDALEEESAQPRDVELSTFERAVRLLEYHLAQSDSVTRHVMIRPEDGESAAAVDDEIAAALRRLVRRGESREETPARWAALLQAEVERVAVSPRSVGHVFKRLEAEERPGLKIERPPRNSARRWRVQRPA